MKSILNVLTAALLLTGLQASADLMPVRPASASAAQVANLLLNPQVLPCLNQLRELQSRFELATSDWGIVRDENAEGAVTSITYDAIEGGDMMMGSVTLTINESWGSQFGFPESRMLFVKSCSIERQILE